MSKRKIVHYSIDEIDKLGANVNLIWGERSNGKSYQVKHKKGIIPYLSSVDRYVDSYLDKGNIIKNSQEAGKRFILMRRFREEITPSWVESYFSDVDIETLTDGEYNMVTMYRKELFLSFFNKGSFSSLLLTSISFFSCLAFFSKTLLISKNKLRYPPEKNGKNHFMENFPPKIIINCWLKLDFSNKIPLL